MLKKIAWLHTPINIIILLVISIAFIYGLFQTISLSWVSDDAFISFRYAKNLVDGKGLVYNAGEKVEGYTNFLWTIIIAGGMLLEFEPVRLAHFLSICSYLITAFIFLLISYHIYKSRSNMKLCFLPLTAISILLLRDFHVYATSGLETAFSTMQICGGFILLLIANNRKQIFYSGLVLTFACLTRPDNALFFLMGIPYIYLTQNLRPVKLIYYIIPFLLIFAPYWIVRYNYYGYPFPNTYYAKSISLSYFSQGLKYLGLFFKTYYILILAVPAAIYSSFLIVKQLLIKRTIEGVENRAILLSLLFVFPYCFYIAKIGGDFMFARFLIPITGFIILLVELNVSLLIKQNITRIIISLVIISGIYFHRYQFDCPFYDTHGIADECKYYTREVTEFGKNQGRKLKSYFSDVDVAVGFIGCQAILIYYSEIPVAIECLTGLTDKYIAHLPIKERGRPGHEKTAPIKYLKDRDINFLFGSKRSAKNGIQAIDFDEVPGVIITYKKQVMDKLKTNPEIHFLDFSKYLEEYVSKIDNIPKEQIRKDLIFFEDYYFDHNEDLLKLEAIRNRLNSG